MTRLIELHNIRHSFLGTEWELNIPDLSLNANEILGIVGPNGSGKSTLLRIAAALICPKAGQVKLLQNNIYKMDRRTIARHLGYLPQELTSEYDYSVEDIVSMGRYAHAKGFGRLDQIDRQVIQESLKLTDTEPLQKRRLSHLSGGEKKRAFLAAVLAQNPQLLLLDEPTSALDIHHQVRFFHLLKSLSQKGVGITVVTHDLNLASLFCDRLLLLKEGHCLALGPAIEVLSEKNVLSVYGDELLIIDHPEIDRPTFLARMPQKEEDI